MKRKRKHFFVPIKRKEKNNTKPQVLKKFPLACQIITYVFLLFWEKIFRHKNVLGPSKILLHEFVIKMGRSYNT